MKLSELMRLLQFVIDQGGDCTVNVRDDDGEAEVIRVTREATLDPESETGVSCTAHIVIERE